MSQYFPPFNVIAPGNVVYYGYVSKRNAVTAANRAGVLLFLIFDSGRRRITSAVSGMISTKIFDYLLSGKPIINIGPPNGELNLFVEQIGYTEFHSFEPFEIDRLAGFLSSVLGDLAGFRKRSGTVEMPDFSESFEAILRGLPQ